MTPTRRSLLLAVLAIPVAGTILRPALASEPEVFATGGIAISGYDPVAYFTDGKPVRGSPDHALMWRGATWYFASAATMEAFEMNPHAYAPQYGGYCAYAMTKGAIAATAPDAFAVSSGRLYLTYSTEIRAIWADDVAGNVALADAHWPAALNKK